MEISDYKKKFAIKNELESKIDGKKDLHYILRHGCKLKIIKYARITFKMQIKYLLHIKKRSLWKEESIITNNPQNTISNFKISS